MVSLPTPDDLGPLIRDEVNSVPGIVRTISCAIADPS
jgi:hypothetical protein